MDTRTKLILAEIVFDLLRRINGEPGETGHLRTLARDIVQDAEALSADRNLCNFTEEDFV